jgi:hypothetical protein
MNDAQRDLMADVLGTALEGGSNYWYEQAIIHSKLPPDPIFGIENYNEVSFVVQEEDEIFSGVRYHTSPALLWAALQKYVVDEPYLKLAPVHIEALRSLRFDDIEDAELAYDSDDADVLLQLATFGEVIYG